MIWPARGRDAISLLASVDALSYSTALRKSRILRGGRSRCGVGGPPLVRHPGAAADPARAPDLLPAHPDSPRDRSVRVPPQRGPAPDWLAASQLDGGASRFQLAAVGVMRYGPRTWDEDLKASLDVQLGKPPVDRS